MMTCMNAIKAVRSGETRTVGGIPLELDEDFDTFRWKKRPLRFLIPADEEFKDKLYRFSDRRRAVLLQDYGALIFFGRDDRRPFVTQLEQSRPILRALRKRDEAAFEDALRPRRLKQLAAKLGVRIWRSGDILGIPVAKDWTEAAQRFRVISGPTGRFPLFNTRHTLTGKLAELPWDADGGSWFALASGTIEAPDHPKVELRKKGKGRKEVHLLTRNCFLDSQCADVELSS